MKPQRRVLNKYYHVVAHSTGRRRWEVLVGLVPGLNAEHDLNMVLQLGSPIPEDLARFLFPEFKHLAYDH